MSAIVERLRAAIALVEQAAAEIDRLTRELQRKDDELAYRDRRADHLLKMLYQSEELRRVSDAQRKAEERDDQA